MHHWHGHCRGGVILSRKVIMSDKLYCQAHRKTELVHAACNDGPQQQVCAATSVREYLLPNASQSGLNTL